MQKFGPFVLHECLGVGGAAMVHRATHDGELRREVALKRLLPAIAREPRAIAAFVEEARLAVELAHPNIARTYELGRVDDTYYIAMELVHGRSLATLVEETRGVPIALAVGLLVELCDAIAYANERLGVIHRDISPCNLLVTDDHHLKMIDFGIARARTRAVTDGGVKGKPSYMAVEALRTPLDLDTRADVFSIGAVAWELLTGYPLFDGEASWSTAEHVRNRALRRPSELAPHVPAALDDIVLAALAYTREARWQSADAMLDALEALRRDTTRLLFSRGERSERQGKTLDLHARRALRLDRRPSAPILRQRTAS